MNIDLIPISEIIIQLVMQPEFNLSAAGRRLERWMPVPKAEGSAKSILWKVLPGALIFI